MKFCSVINCIDGRVQTPVQEFLKKRFDVDYVDSITHAGPTLPFSENKPEIEPLIKNLEISVVNHNSKGIAIAGHYDCAGNPAKEEDQIVHIKKSVALLRSKFKTIEVIGLWVDRNWEVVEIN